MLEIDIGAAVRGGAALPATTIAAGVSALRDDGCVLLADAVDPAHVAVLREQAEADIPRLTGRRDAPFNWHRGNLQLGAPRDLPWLFADVWFNPAVLALTSALLPGVSSGFYSGNTALPGSQRRQPVHADCSQLWAGITHPACAIVINLMLHDVHPGNGATELWPGTHRLGVAGPGEPLEIPEPILAQRRREVPPFQPTAKAGSLLLRDMRLWHAGMPNPSDAPRSMLAMIHSAGWYLGEERVLFTERCRDFFADPRLRSRVSFAPAVDHLGLDRPYALTG